MAQYIEFVTNHWDLFAALAIILFMLMGSNFSSRLRGYSQVEPVDAVRIYNHEDAVILDVRDDKEYEEGHILDSLHIPLGKLGERLSELANMREKAIIVSCRSGHRSATACARLRKEGFETVYNLKGGVLAWQNAGLPLQKKKRAKGKKR
ncbi:MAG: rhodanese-like domain-containing protein [Chromatiales bacterium]|nr:rhodanese-like domain-containing protein [Chromatiales bacterium]